MHQGQEEDEEARKGSKNLIEFKDTKIFKAIKSRKKKVLIFDMRNNKDEVEASRKGIANTFVKFYSDLCADGRSNNNKEKLKKETTIQDKQARMTTSRTSQSVNYSMRLTVSKKEKQAAPRASKLKTSKNVAMTRKKSREAFSTR